MVEKNDGQVIMMYDGDFDGSSEACEAFTRPGTPAFDDHVDNETGVVPFVLYPVQSWKENWHDQFVRAWGLDDVARAITDYDKYLNDTAVAWSWSPNEHQTGSKHGILHFWTMDEINNHLDLDDEKRPLGILKIGWYATSSAPWPDYITLDSILSAHVAMIRKYRDEAETEEEDKSTGNDLGAKRREQEGEFRYEVNEVADLFTDGMDNDVTPQRYSDMIRPHVNGFLGDTTLDSVLAETRYSGGKCYVFIKNKDKRVCLVETKLLDQWPMYKWNELTRRAERYEWGY